MTTIEFLASFSFAIFALLMCLLTIGGALDPQHESCQPEGGELDIPSDREFIDLDTRPQIPNPVFGRFESPTFPQDHTYATPRL